jgi:hypothetical protein
MTNKAEYVQLESGDDVASVRDRLSFLRGQRVLLIWPEEGVILNRKLDLVLIQREAMRRAIRLALVTHDPQVVRYARELNISTFETIGASERGHWQRGRSKVFTNRFQRPKDEPIPDDLKEIASRIYAEETRLQQRWRRIRMVIGLALFLVAAGVIGYVLLPSATVTLTPAQNPVEASADIIVDPLAAGVDVEHHIIPAIKVSAQIEDSGTIETTGTQDLGNAPAVGSVVFINQTEQAVTIPAGTTITTSTSAPIQFRTTQEASLPGGTGLQVEVPIEALSTSAGAIGNVDSGTINTVIGPLATSVTVRNIAPTSGGSSRAQKTVTTQDIATVIGIVRQQLQSRAFLEMQAKLTESQCIILQTVQIAEQRNDWMTFSAQPGDAADTLSLTMRAVVEATALDEQLGRQIVYAELSKQVQPGQFIIPESVTYEEGCDTVNSTDAATGRITVSMGGNGIVTAQLDTDQIRDRLAGLSMNDAIAFLVSEFPLQQGFAPQISISPDWFGNLPILPMRINVQLQSAATS